MKVVTSKEMKEIEKAASELGILPLLLMENAAIAVVSVIIQTQGDIKNKKFTILSGPGNNGGDGFAVARHLCNKGAIVKVLMFSGKNRITEEAEKNYEIVKKIGVPIIEINKFDENTKHIISHSDCIVDAIFGTGLSRKVDGVFAEVISYINNLKKTVYAIDVPSGINADTGDLSGETVRADHTIALGFYKPGHLLFPSRSYCGNLFLADISLPGFLANDIRCEKIDEGETKTFFKKREPYSHKGRYGHLALIGGSPGKTGAIIMASKAAMKVGVGLATIICPHSLNSYIENAQLEVMTFPVGDINGCLSFAAVDAVKDFINNKNAVVIGPGLSANEITEEFFFSLLNDMSKPTVIDADGINLLARDKSILKDKKGPMILTPHIGEMARLLNVSKEKIVKNPIEIARDFAVKEGVFLVLKSATTVLATPEDEVFISTYGCAGMATAGVGDLLSGIIGSFLAQGYDTKKSVLLGLTLHGISGQLAGDDLGNTTLMATDILNYMQIVLKKWEETL